jgi:hypothetical protein
LSTLFLLGALGLTPAGPGSRRPTARAWGMGVLVALSFGAKESGLVGLPILFVQHWTTHRTLAPAARLRSAIPAIAPAVLLCGLAFGVRMAVIGGLGGYVEPAQGTYLGRLFGGFIGYVSLLGMTSPWDESAAAAAIGTLSILAMAAIACVAMLSATTLERDEARRGLPLAATGATWVAFQVAVAGNSVEFSPRYAFGMLAGASLMLAAVVDVALRAAREGTGRRRALGVAQLALAMIVVVGGLRGSPAWHAYPGLAKASRIESDELAALATLLATDPPKGRHPFSVQRQVVIHARAVDHAWMLAPWSVQAWVDLRFPELALRVERDDTRPRSAKYWHLVMTPKDAEHGR